MKTTIKKNHHFAGAKQQQRQPFFLSKRHFIISMLSVVVMLAVIASCKKIDIVKTASETITDQAFKAIVAPDQFTWSSTKSVTLDITPLQTDSDLYNTLYVKTLDGKTVLSYNISMRQALQLKFDLPTDTTQVKVVYGTIEKTIAIIADRVAFDFITPIPAQYQ